MKYLLDTDHLSILQRQTGKDYSNLSARLVSDFKVLPLVSFDAGAATTFEQLKARRIQLAKMDARIAAIALSRELILLTRNHRDFGKVAGLAIEDWTI
ncbi:hypothetical protein QUA43_13340 [Microcoleus sp. N9_B4]|jgi:tRNA(fMet)-specific endonuclease VapC|uniref:PIN domain-containing protein n=1 Tax=Microcoleus sp. N9_B4 TaxID=3055386 RepID=UPI002FD4AB67